LISAVKIEDFQSRSPQRDAIRFKHALLVGTAMHQGIHRTADAVRRRGAVFMRKTGDAAQILFPRSAQPAGSRVFSRGVRGVFASAGSTLS
jgi:hypothetical protein